MERFRTRTQSDVQDDAQALSAAFLVQLLVNMVAIMLITSGRVAQGENERSLVWIVGASYGVSLVLASVLLGLYLRRRREPEPDDEALAIAHSLADIMKPQHPAIRDSQASREKS